MSYKEMAEQELRDYIDLQGIELTESEWGEAVHNLALWLSANLDEAMAEAVYQAKK